MNPEMEKKLPHFMKDAHSVLENNVEYKGVWFPGLVRPHIMENLKNFEVREDDLVLVTYPKAGTHWMNEVLLLMKQDGHVDKIKREFDHDVIGDLAFGVPPEMKKSVADGIAKLPSPRYYITHLPEQLLPPQIWTKKAKVVYLTRNPKDACVSMYRFANAHPRNKQEIPFSSFFDVFITKKAHFGNWFDHALGYWSHRNDDNVIFITFEEMKKDMRAVIRRLETFLGLTITSEGMERILEHSSLDGMKKTYAKIEEDNENGRLVTRAFGLIPFIQTGKSGGWKAHFSEEQSKIINDMVKEKLTGTGLDKHYN